MRRKFMDSCITGIVFIQFFPKRKEVATRVKGPYARGHMHACCMTRVQSWFLVGSKGHMHTFAAKLFLAKQSNMCGTGWEEIVGSQFTHRLCSCSARTCTCTCSRGVGCCFVAFAWLSGRMDAKRWPRPSARLPAYATGGHLRTCRLCPCKCMYLHAKRGCFLRLFFHYNF